MLGHTASLTQCLTNLLDNAVKFMPPGKQARVRVYTEVHADRVRVCVADNGIDIDAEGQKRLFGMFERLNSPNMYQGTGAGLAIVRRAAERMNGKVGISSAVGLGSTFCLPGLVVLDLKMPRRSELQVLEWMRAENVIRSVLMLVFSSSANQSDIEAAYEAGASGFLIKPPSSDERVELASFIKNWLRLIQPPLAAAEGFEAALAHRAGQTTAAS